MGHVAISQGNCGNDKSMKVVRFEANDQMQQGCVYTLTEPTGGISPDQTGTDAEANARTGRLRRRIHNRLRRGSTDWFVTARLCTAINHFGVNARALSLAPEGAGSNESSGLVQWYCPLHQRAFARTTKANLPLEGSSPARCPDREKLPARD